ncbi:hypothetical protein EVAR_83254_1 [Eumeta japonica]|uniref:Uncharacterized protein n=1 Tax=Eumeta variegata TaxID=151549 RepID=A0A4C1Y1Z6_EUMVA|nr:hypothetical protein EVAR_83254_1 [Eumeta japonica]
MTSQTTLIASPSATGRHGYGTDGVATSRHGRRLVKSSAWDVAGNRRAFSCRCQGVRWIGKLRFVAYGWVGCAVDSQPPRVNALGCDPAMSKNRFDASSIYLEIVGSSKSLEN